MPEQTITAYEDLQFVPIAEGSPVEVAMLWGNPETGPCAVMVRLPEGYREPWHSHSSSYHSVLVKGTFQTRNREHGESVSDSYGPGAYVVQQGGADHGEINAGEGELVALVYFEGPVDVVLAEG